MSCSVVQTNKGIIKRSDFFKGYLVFDAPVNGSGMLTLTWTDSCGRRVLTIKEKREQSGTRVDFKFPLDRAVALQNFLDVEFEINNSMKKAPLLEFIVTPEPNKLDDYNIVMYYPYKQEYQNNLRNVGITAGQVFGGSIEEGKRARLWYSNNFRFYVDQITIDYYATYHSPRFDPKYKLLTDDKNKYKTSGRTDKTAFYRNPCFFDADETKKAMDRIKFAVSTLMKFKPLFYSTDETGVADLVTAWDYCLDERTLIEMRKWLIEQYGDLESINKEWGTDFKDINDVVPFTTDEIFMRDGNNLSPWADHRFFMNKVFADAIRWGTEAAHSIDPEAKHGIVGCQMPAAFGGYDYWLLSKSTDFFEPYNLANNREIIRSINPKKPCVTTSFGHGDNEVWRLWHQALHGDRGIIIYDEKHSYLKNDGDGSPTDMGLACASVYKELTSGIVKQLTYTDELHAFAAIHYSQPSITAYWKFEVSASDGEKWVDRYPGQDNHNSDFFLLRESFVKLMEDNFIDYTFVAYGQLENGEFDMMDKKLLLLPQSVAMSEKEVEAVKRFVRRGGTLVADCSCALMDGHCKELEIGQLDDFFGISRSTVSMTRKPGSAPLKAESTLPTEYAWAAELLNVNEITKAVTAEQTISVNSGAIALYKDDGGNPAVIVKNHGYGKTVYLNIDITKYYLWRLKTGEGESVKSLFSELAKISGIMPYFPVKRTKGNKVSLLEMFNRQSGDMNLIAIHRNYQLRISELGPPQYQDLGEVQGEVGIELNLGTKRAVYDVRKGVFLGEADKVNLDIDIWEPTVISTFESPAESLDIIVQKTAKGADIVTAHIALNIKKPAVMHIFRCGLKDPNGDTFYYMTKNLTAPYGKAFWSFPLAEDTIHGVYTIEVKDIATGTKNSAEFSVQ